MLEQTRLHEGKLTVSEVMTDAPPTVMAGTPLFRIADILSSSRYRHVLVKDAAGRLLGVASSRDVLRLMSEVLEDTYDDWRSHTVESVMFTNFLASSPDADAGDVATMIASGSIQCVPVLEGEKLVGVLTPDDLLMSLNRLDPVLREAGNDSLTKLANRASFDRRLEEEWSRCGRQNMALGLILIDVDHFKEINDTCGHATGDAVLQMIATCLTRCLRPYDVIARFGGDEFVAICAGCDWETIGSPIGRLQEDLKNVSVPIRTGRRGVAVSIGAAVIRDGYEAFDSEQLLAAADAALYAAKRAGRDQSYRCELTAERQEPVPLFAEICQEATSA